MRLLTLAALRGAFQGRVDDVNDVNARSVAEHQGIEVREQTRAGASDYTNLVAVTARDGDDATVVGTTLGLDNRPWLVRALGYEVEIQLDPRMLVLENADVPGMIGKVGTRLRAHPPEHREHERLPEQLGGVALMVVSVDQDPPDELLDALEQTEGVASRPRFIRLDSSAPLSGRRGPFNEIGARSFPAGPSVA